MYSRALGRPRKERTLENGCKTAGDGPPAPALEIGESAVRAIVRHLRDALPCEGCGLLATVGAEGYRRVARFFPGDNIDRSATRFTMDPRQVIAAMDEMARNGWSLGAIVHSHPRTPPVPSVTDLREAYYPDAWLLIVGFAGKEPELRVWDVGSVGRGEPPREVRIRVVPGCPFSPDG